MGEPASLSRFTRRGGLERVVHDLMQVMLLGLEAEATSARRGLLQGLDPRFKLALLLSLILCAVLTHSLWWLLALFLLALLLAVASGIALVQLATRVWFGVLLFTGVIALPAIFLVPGDAIWQMPVTHWNVTAPGLRSAAFLLGRAAIAATFAFLLILSTPWMHVLKALRAIGVPVVVVAILGMTHRYLFVLLKTAIEMFEARRSRVVAPLRGAPQRKLVVSAAGVLLEKSFQLSSEVHLAMVSRGYRGEVRLLDDFRARRRDWCALLLALALPAAILWSQR